MRSPRASRKRALAARDTLRPRERWQMLPAVVAAAEVARIAGIALQWIERFDRPRPPFTASLIEEKAQVALAGLTFGLRLDRVDTLPDGSVAIIDYKTGPVDAPKTWFAERPRSPQLGLYALALRAQDPPLQVSAVAYAQLKAGSVKVQGLAADKTSWDALDSADTLREPTRMAGGRGVVGTAAARARGRVSRRRSPPSRRATRPRAAGGAGCSRCAASARRGSAMRTRASHERAGPLPSANCPEARSAEGSPMSAQGRSQARIAPKRAARRVVQ